MDEKILTNTGLTAAQSKIYLALLENGMSSVKVISSKSGLGRALTYKILKQLIALKLVDQRDNIGKIALFLPAHPQKIRNIVTQKLAETEQASRSFEALYGKLTSDFNMLSGKPNVQFYEGYGGIKQIYDDILTTNQDIQIISSPIDEGRTEALDLIREQILKQKAQNIRTKAITPIGLQKEYATAIEDDEKYLITRKPVLAEKLRIPAQIIIYGDKVAITNFKESVITVLVESKYIAETFRIMFEFIWNSGQ